MINYPFPIKRRCSMFLNIGKRLWLAALTLPLQGFGQEIIRDPQNATVCVGGVARFTSETTGGLIGWLIDNVIIENLPTGKSDLLEIDHITTPNGTTIQTLKFTKYDELFDGAEVVSFLLPGNTESNPAYLIYETNHQSSATGLIATANDTAIQASWDASELTAQYLVNIRNITETPVVVDSPHYVYFPESQGCQWYEFLVTVHECFNSTDLDTRQNTAASVRVAYPNTSPVSLEVSGEEVLINWSGDSSALEVIASLRNGSKTLMTHTGTLPFTYVATGCGQYNLNVTVSPAQCEGEPDFTQSASIGFTILCPTTPTEPETEVTGESSGTLAMYPSLLAVVAFIPVLKWRY